MERRGWSTRRAATWLLAAALLGACGEGIVTPPTPTPDPSVAPFVGTWDAEVFTVTSDADPGIVADLMENGSFTINVQPSGTYTATLVFGGLQVGVEIGDLSVSGDFVTLRPTGGDPATSEYTFVEDDYLRLEGPTEFDFNLDEELEPAQAFIELQRR
jgi:hypothetical protein